MTLKTQKEKKNIEKSGKEKVMSPFNFYCPQFYSEQLFFQNFMFSVMPTEVIVCERVVRKI